MKTFVRSLASGILFVTFIASAAPPRKAESLTADELFAGSTVPKERNFPLSSKIEPCTDFYGYVCDEVRSQFILPADRVSYYFSFSDIDEKILHAKKNYFKLLEQNLEPKTQHGKMLRDYYLSCLNEKARKEEEKAFVAEVIKSFAAIKTSDELVKWMIDRGLKGQGSPMDLGIIANQADPNWNDAVISSDLLSLNEKSFYEKPQLLADYQKAIEVLFKEIGLNSPDQRAQQVVQFESQVAKDFPAPEVIRDRVSSNTYKDKNYFQKNYPNLFLGPFLNKIPEKIKIRDFLPETMKFLNAFSKPENLEILKNDFLFQTLNGKLEKAYPEVYQAFFNFRKKHMEGLEKLPSENERCTRKTEAAMGNALDFELMQTLFPKFDSARIETIVENIRKSILTGIQKNKWLSAHARKEAQLKIEKAVLKLVAPKNLQEWDLMKEIPLDATKYIANAEKIYALKKAKQLSELQVQRNRDKWYYGPLDVNAFYQPAENSFTLTRAILLPPFMSEVISDTEILGGIGSVVGHELGHAIDDEGAKYDYLGRIKGWMKPSDLNAFHSRGDQFVGRFNKIGHNGKLTLGENIGDHVGISFSFQTAFPDLEKSSLEDLKKFFISYGRTWCNVSKPSVEEVQLKTDPHSLGWARVNEQVIHLDGFYEAFQCKFGDKMFVPPKDRIRVW